MLEAEYDYCFDVFFPSLILVSRDNSLKFTDTAGKAITPDEYLEQAITIKSGRTASSQIYNAPRECVRKYFKERKYFTISPPKNPEKLGGGKTPANGEFDKDIDTLIQYIYSRKPKCMVSGKILNGRSEHHIFSYLIIHWISHSD